MSNHGMSLFASAIYPPTGEPHRPCDPRLFEQVALLDQRRDLSRNAIGRLNAQRVRKLAVRGGVALDPPVIGDGVKQALLTGW